MQFMTTATLRNLPAYLAEDRARRLEKQQLEEQGKRDAYLASMNKIAKAFVKQGDYSAAGLKKFAETNDLSMPEIEGLMKIAATFSQIQKQRADTPKVWTRDQSGIQTRVEDTPGLVNYPEAKKPDMVWQRDASGKMTRVEDKAGLESYPTPKEPNYVWQRGADGTMTRVEDKAGLTSYPATTGTESTKVPDYMKYAVQTLGKSLGYSNQSGWPDKESEHKFNMVIQNVDAIMKDKKPGDINQVLFDTIKMYDSEKEAAQAIDAIPENSTFTSAKDAKAVVDEAARKGGNLDEIKTILEQRGWKEKDVKKLMESAKAQQDKSAPKELTAPGSNAPPAPTGGKPYINTEDQIDQDPNNPLGL